LRFLPLQRLPARDALSVAAVLRTIPLRRFPSSLDPRVRGPLESRRRPCGFSLCECDAVKLDDGRRLRFRTPFAPHKCGGNVHTDVLTTSHGHLCSQTRRRIRLSVTRTCDPFIKRHRFAHSPNRAGHASSLSLGTMFRYRRRLIAAWPGDWSFPLARPAALLGFCGTLRRFAPAHGWRIISDRAGPTCLFVQSSRPD
jgi:hypothetical protein